MFSVSFFFYPFCCWLESNSASLNVFKSSESGSESYHLQIISSIFFFPISKGISKEHISLPCSEYEVQCSAPFVHPASYLLCLVLEVVPLHFTNLSMMTSLPKAPKYHLYFWLSHKHSHQVWLKFFRCCCVFSF